MANTWFRMYHEWATDPKIQMLPEVVQRRYVMLLCFKCCNVTVTLHDQEVAFQLRVTSDEWAETKALLIDRNLITEHNEPTQWDKRQFVSDTSALRVARHRAKKKPPCNGDVTLHVTKCNALDTDTDTDTDKIKTPVDEIFDHWKLKANHPKAKLDDKRKKFIRSALKLGYSQDDLCKAIDGMMVTPHNIGKNGNNTVYDGINIVFKDADQIDRFISSYQQPPKPTGSEDFLKYENLAAKNGLRQPKRNERFEDYQNYINAEIVH